MSDDGNVSEGGASVDPLMWKCPKCFTKNVVGENNDHCNMCDASRPDHVQGHGIGAKIPHEQYVGEEDRIVSNTMKKKGNVEHALKHDPNETVDENDPKARLVKLNANEKVKHKKNELDSDASESDIEELHPCITRTRSRPILTRHWTAMRKLTCSYILIVKYSKGKLREEGKQRSDANEKRSEIAPRRRDKTLCFLMKVNVKVIWRSKQTRRKIQTVLTP